MLTADLADARRSGKELLLKRLDARARDEALALAGDLLDVARAHVGLRREELDAAWDAVCGEARKPRLAKGMRKLLDDACVFEASEGVDPIAVRQALFTRASEVRASGGPFDREAIVAEVAGQLGLETVALERALFSDLRGQHVLREVPPLNAASLAEAYELGRAQAVLLRAVRVICDVRAASPGPLRAFFARLKFLQLLFTAERTDEGFRVTIDGPFSMFEASTRYGLRLAMIVPALRALDRWSVVAEIRWGKERTPLTFRMASTDVAPGGDLTLEPHLSDDVRELLQGLEGKSGKWRIEAATTILDVPGLGVCIPDLVFRRGDEEVFLEVLGFWSRDAVFKRVDLVTRGLGAHVVFAAGARLRVSEELLGDDVPASLYVYKGKMSPRAVLEHVERVVSRARD